MAKPRVFLHIGMHKTGTTAFQIFCARHADGLKQRGFLYPESGRPVNKDVSYGHHLLAWSMTRPAVDPVYWPSNMAKAEEVWDRLVDEIQISECTTAIISTEEFDTLGPEHAGAVLERLSSFDVQPIVYLRRFDELVQALYTTNVVYNGEQGSFDDYLTRMRTPLDYEAIIAPWARSDNCPIVRYYDPALSRRGLVGDLLGVIGIDRCKFGEESEERVNVGNWPWYVVEVCRQMNACGMRGVVVKFAYIMRAVVEPSTTYDLIRPSQAAALKRQGLESLLRSKKRFALDAPPAHFLDTAIAGDDEHWQAIRDEENAAMVRVLQQLSRLTDLPRPERQ
jgi:hypothetical protein